MLVQVWFSATTALRAITFRVHYLSHALLIAIKAGLYIRTRLSGTREAADS